jgi:hypothetical protein
MVWCVVLSTKDEGPGPGVGDCDWQKEALAIRDRAPAGEGEGSRMQWGEIIRKQWLEERMQHEHGRAHDGLKCH